MKIYALEDLGPTLRDVVEALADAGYTVSISTRAAGEASEEELDDEAWECAFVRWPEPELHDVYLLERGLVGIDEEADRAVASAIKAAQNLPESAGKLIVVDHLRKTNSVIDVEILPTMLDQEDHEAWRALDVALRRIATEAGGIVHAAGEGFYDADGEPLLAEQ